MSMSKAQKIISWVISAVVAGLLFWLTQLDGVSQVKQWFGGPEIEVASFDRPFSKEFFTKEKLHFALQKVESDRVFWIFDEKEMQPGGIAIDYQFTPDKSPFNRTADHRVDAIYKHGDSYSSVTRKVRVSYIDFAGAAQVQGEELHLTSPNTVASDWRLAGVDLGFYSEGKFQHRVAVAVGDGTKTAIGFSWRLPFEKLRALFTAGGSPSDPWAQYVFRSQSSGQTMSLMSRVSFENNEPPKKP